MTDGTTGLPEAADRSSEIAEAIVGAIVEQRLAPGTRLGEDDLGTTFGVSRTIVRAALRMLARDQIVTMRPHRGATVASPTVTEARQVFHARRVVEAALIRDAAKSCKPADVRALRGHIAAEGEALARGDRSAAIRLSGDFHMRIAQLSRQDVLTGFLRELISRSALVIALYGTTRASSCGTQEHEALLEAIARHDADTAVALMTAHLEHVEHDLDLARGKGTSLDLATALVGRRS
ncbi:GntR family transcriptional regulator [uncultured Alsobacter sp.]|uniref:GntR family transcriptional regulator n=1 Tax=uncultured Alsobacter sp. TaxID=1748258 RepID=UPI0025E4F500|nr:GntR family transcriptional regulator [uncultured Alsobacter sp.]